MKINKIKLLVLAVVGVVFALSVPAFAADNYSTPGLAVVPGGTAVTVFNYTGLGTNSVLGGGTNYFSQRGTNDLLGYTNAVKYVDVSKVKDLYIGVKAGSVIVDATNQFRVVAWVSKNGTTATASRLGSYTFTAGASPGEYFTNTTAYCAPWIGLQIESGIVDTAAGSGYSNMVLSVFGKP